MHCAAHVHVRAASSESDHVTVHVAPTRTDAPHVHARCASFALRTHVSIGVQTRVAAPPLHLSSDSKAASRIAAALSRPHKVLRASRLIFGLPQSLARVVRLRAMSAASSSVAVSAQTAAARDRVVYASPVPSDIAISQALVPLDISAVAADAGILASELDLYGTDKAKVHLSLWP